MREEKITGKTYPSIGASIGWLSLLVGYLLQQDSVCYVAIRT